jgi:DNA-binding transcriptional LysR family regulator
VVANAFRAAGLEPPRLTVSSLSYYAHAGMLATGRFLTGLPSFMLKVPSRNPPLKGLPVTLPNTRMPIGIVTLKNRAFTPLAQRFIENVRVFAKSLAND